MEVFKEEMKVLKEEMKVLKEEMKVLKEKDEKGEKDEKDEKDEKKIKKDEKGKKDEKDKKKIKKDEKIKREREEKIKREVEEKINKAICITFGEQSENHVGMKKYGNGLSENGFNCIELEEMKIEFEKEGCECEMIDLCNLLGEEERGNIEAKVLIIRNCIDKMLGEGKSESLLEDLLKLKWDNKYWDSRFKRVNNKHARYNLCFGEENKEEDYENGIGRVISYDDVEILKGVKNKMENICKEKKFECEGNYYFDAKKCGIGFHGDGERKKVIGVSLCSSDVVREINWIWYNKSERISERQVVKLNNGDCYIMSEKSSGFDWKRRSIKTLRHAAGVENNIFLK